MAKTKITGIVESTSQDTVKVVHSYKTKHPKYQKIIKKFSNFLADDKQHLAKVGDQVEIEECPKISKNKNFKVIRVI
jgi:small subunit ribosomal protein S17